MFNTEAIQEKLNMIKESIVIIEQNMDKPAAIEYFVGRISVVTKQLMELLVR